MKKYLALVLGLVLVGTAATLYAEDNPGAVVEKKAAATAVYVCPDCHTMAMQAGKCTGCQKDLVAMHVLGMKDGQAMLCACGADCKCNAAGVKDGKCACGKEVKMMAPKGMYVCACAGAKCCSTISDKPGKCKCGEDLKKVE